MSGGVQLREISTGEIETCSKSVKQSFDKSDILGYRLLE